MENLFFIMVKARQYKMTKQEDAVLKAPKILGTLRYPGHGGKENGESLERGRRHLRGKNKLRLSRLG